MLHLSVVVGKTFIATILKLLNAILMINITHLLHIYYYTNLSFSAFQQTVEGGSYRLPLCRHVHGGYSVNRNVRCGSHSMADEQKCQNRHTYFSIKTAFNKMFSVHTVLWNHSNYDVM